MLEEKQLLQSFLSIFVSNIKKNSAQIACLIFLCTGAFWYIDDRRQRAGVNKLIKLFLPPPHDIRENNDLHIFSHKPQFSPKKKCQYNLEVENSLFNQTGCKRYGERKNFGKFLKPRKKEGSRKSVSRMGFVPLKKVLLLQCFV